MSAIWTNDNIHPTANLSVSVSSSSSGYSGDSITTLDRDDVWKSGVAEGDTSRRIIVTTDYGSAWRFKGMLLTNLYNSTSPSSGIVSINVAHNANNYTPIYDYGRRQAYFDVGSAIVYYDNVSGLLAEFIIDVTVTGNADALVLGGIVILGGSYSPLPSVEPRMSIAPVATPAIFETEGGNAYMRNLQSTKNIISYSWQGVSWTDIDNALASIHSTGIYNRACVIGDQSSFADAALTAAHGLVFQGIPLDIDLYTGRFNGSLTVREL